MSDDEWAVETANVVGYSAKRFGHAVSSMADGVGQGASQMARGIGQLASAAWQLGRWIFGG